MEVRYEHQFATPELCRQPVGQSGHNAAAAYQSQNTPNTQEQQNSTIHQNWEQDLLPQTRH